MLEIRITTNLYIDICLIEEHLVTIFKETIVVCDLLSKCIRRSLIDNAFLTSCYRDVVVICFQNVLDDL